MLAGLLFTFAVPSSAFGDGDEQLSQLAWMVGDWQTRDDSQFVQEAWLQPVNGYMSGLFRLFSGERFVVHEYLFIAREKEDVLLRFKHFREDYTTWEEDAPLTLRLAEVRDGYALFENINPQPEAPDLIEYARDGERLKVTVSDRPGPQAGEPLVFELKLKP